MESVTYFIFLGSKIIAHGDCSHEIKTCLEIKRCLPLGRASLIAQLVKFPPAMWEAPVQFLGWENPLEKGQATHSSILAWRIPWTVHRVAKSQTRLSNFHFHFAPWKKSYDKPRQLIKKQTLLYQQRSVQSKLWFFQQSCMDVSWTIKIAERQINDAFELWYWRRLLRVPWTPRRSNQSVLEEISSEYSLEGLMLKLL